MGWTRSNPSSRPRENAEPVNIPMFGEHGRLMFILHHAIDVGLTAALLDA
ncbi:MAG: hypothetical protein QM676_02815 [Novosphingobium sp.]